MYVSRQQLGDLRVILYLEGHCHQLNVQWCVLLMNLQPILIVPAMELIQNSAYIVVHLMYIKSL